MFLPVDTAIAGGWRFGGVHLLRCVLRPPPNGRARVRGSVSIWRGGCIVLVVRIFINGNKSFSVFVASVPVIKVGRFMVATICWEGRSPSTGSGAGLIVLVLIIFCGLCCGGGGGSFSASFSRLYPSGGHPLPHPSNHLILLRSSVVHWDFLFLSLN